jgi:RHS repeat-associated protein
LNILITKVDYVAYKDPSDPLNKIIIRAAVYGGSSFDGPIRNISVTGNVAIDKFFEEGNLVSCQSKRVRGIKLYEVSNYLGNVHAVITDRKIPIKKTDGTESVSFYQSELVQFSDYYPFGQTVKSRTSTSQIYNFAYNGMLKDDEIQGVGNSYTTFFREYNPRLGRWTAIDPKFSKLPHQSSYCSMDNNPIVYNDPLGDIVRYEKFRDRVNVFFARMGSKEFRSEHKARVNSQDTYTYTKRPDSPY